MPFHRPSASRMIDGRVRAAVGGKWLMAGGQAKSENFDYAGLPLRLVLMEGSKEQLVNLLVTIRPLVAADQEFLWEALYEALWDPAEAPRRPREVLERPYIRIYAEKWGSQSDDLGFVALDEHARPIGAIWSRLHLPPNQGGAFFNASTPQVGIAVFPAWQGRRIGSQLMGHYLAEARKKYEGVSLSVHPANHRAIRLYERVGFKQFAVGGGGYLNMVVHLVMQRREEAEGAGGRGTK